MCHCLLVVNHAIDEWRRRLSAFLTLKTDILNITYDCYSQGSHHNVKMAALEI